MAMLRPLLFYVVLSLVLGAIMTILWFFLLRGMLYLSWRFFRNKSKASKG